MSSMSRDNSAHAHNSRQDATREGVDQLIESAATGPQSKKFYVRRRPLLPQGVIGRGITIILASLCIALGTTSVFFSVLVGFALIPIGFIALVMVMLKHGGKGKSLMQPKPKIN